MPSEWPITAAEQRLVPLEVLNFALALLRRFFRRKRSEVTAFAGARIFLPRIKPIFSACQLADHGIPRAVHQPLEKRARPEER